MPCGICHTPGHLTVTPAGRYHRECLRMQRKGLLWTGTPRPHKDSTGQPCQGCGGIIDGQHAHRGGRPFHRECLT